jgi:hypothetical protein
MKYKLSIALLCATGSAVCMDQQRPPLERSLTPRTEFFMKIMTTEKMATDVQATLDNLARETLADAIHQSPYKVHTLMAVRQCVSYGLRDFALLSDRAKNFALTDVVRITLENKRKRINERIQAWADTKKTSPHLDADLGELLELLKRGTLLRAPIEALEQERAELPLFDDNFESASE